MVGSPPSLEFFDQVILEYSEAIERLNFLIILFDWLKFVSNQIWL